MNGLAGLNQEEKQSYFRTLVGMAFGDGEIREREKQLLESIAGELGLRQVDVTALAADPGGGDFVLPDDPAARFRLLYDSVNMMIVDGELKQSEKQLCAGLAENMGLPAEAVDSVARGIVAGDRNMQDPAEVCEALRKKLQP